jgi:hypothetical protein
VSPTRIVANSLKEALLAEESVPEATLSAGEAMQGGNS